MRQNGRRADELDRSSLGDLLDSLLSSAGGGEDDLPRDDIALLGIQFAPRAMRSANALVAAQRG